jgi:large repetitive protein
VQITITGTLAAGTDGQSAVDSATVSSNTGDPDLSNNTDTLSQLIGPVADVSISKTAFLSDGTTQVTNPLAVGDTFIYRLIVANHGPSPATAVVVNDTLPTGMTLTTPVPAGCTGSTVIACDVGTLPAGGTPVVIDLRVSVGPGAANTAPANTATVSSATRDVNTTDNSATATVGVGQVANLALSKSVLPQTANVGDLVTYRFAVSNDIPTVENGVALPHELASAGGTVTDTLPAGLEFVSSTTGCTAESGTVTCPVSSVAQGQLVTVSFTARITAAGAGTTIQNTANVATTGGIPDFNPADNTDHASLIVNPQAELSLTKTVSDSNPATDDEVQYTLTAHNGGPNDATGVTIHDSLPAGLQFIDATPGCDNQSGTVTCDLGTIASGDSASVTIDARTTRAAAGTTVGNLATVTANELDSNPANNRATATIHVRPLVDLRLTKVASNPAPAAGSTVSYTLTLVNHGPSPATGVVINDPLPGGLSFVSAGAGRGACSASGQRVTCRLGTLAAGGAAVVTITARVGSSAVGRSVQNTATATADEPIARPQLLTASASIRAVTSPPPPPPKADLAISKKANHATARVGEAITYTVTVSNHGPDTAVSPTVTDAFSKRVAVVSASVHGGSCSKRTPLTCKLASIPSGGHATIKIVAKATSSGRLRNSAAVVSRTPDSNGHNDIAHATVNVKPGKAALRIEKTASRRTVSPGQALSFSITVRSLGPQPARSVEVCDQLGPGMTFIAVHGASFHGGNPCWTISSLAKGKLRRFVVKVRAPMVDGPRRLTNSATVTAQGVRKRSARATVRLVGLPPPPPPGGVTG